MKRLILIAMVVLLSSSMALAQDICESDFTCDGDVDAEDVSTFLEDFGRSQFFNPCPPCVPLEPVLKTGQTLCYDELYSIIDCTGTGQDGEYQKGYERFADNGDGTVTDTFTKLIWLKDADCFGTKKWINALSDCNGLANGSCSLTDSSSAGDWRLPNANELRSILEGYNFGIDGIMPIGHPFISYSVAKYWSSTTVATSYDYAIDFTSYPYQFGHSPKDSLQYFWCVRDPL